MRPDLSQSLVVAGHGIAFFQEVIGGARFQKWYTRSNPRVHISLGVLISKSGAIKTGIAQQSIDELD
jgi:hypothetical protein